MDEQPSEASVFGEALCNGTINQAIKQSINLAKGQISRNKYDVLNVINMIWERLLIAMPPQTRL